MFKMLKHKLKQQQQQQHTDQHKSILGENCY